MIFTSIARRKTNGQSLHNYVRRFYGATGSSWSCRSVALRSQKWPGGGPENYRSAKKNYSLWRKGFLAHSLYLISPSIKFIMSAQNTIRVICLQDNETNINIFLNSITECEYVKIEIIKFCQCIIHYSILLLLSPRIWVWTFTLKVAWN